MSLRCPLCGSSHLKTLPYVLASGTYQVKVYDDNIIIHNARSNTPWQEDRPYHLETHYTDFAHLALPPYRKTFDGPLFGIIICAAMLALVQLHFFVQVLLVSTALGGLTCLGWSLINCYYNLRIFPADWRHWQESMLCLECGHILEPETIAVQTLIQDRSDSSHSPHPSLLSVSDFIWRKEHVRGKVHHVKHEA